MATNASGLSAVPAAAPVAAPDHSIVLPRNRGVANCRRKAEALKGREHARLVKHVIEFEEFARLWRRHWRPNKRTVLMVPDYGRVQRV